MPPSGLQQSYTHRLDIQCIAVSSKAVACYYYSVAMVWDSLIGLCSHMCCHGSRMSSGGARS